MIEFIANIFRNTQYYNWNGEPRINSKTENPCFVDDLFEQIEQIGKLIKSKQSYLKEAKINKAIDQFKESFLQHKPYFLQKAEGRDVTNINVCYGELTHHERTEGVVNVKHYNKYTLLGKAASYTKNTELIKFLQDMGADNNLGMEKFTENKETCDTSSKPFPVISCFFKRNLPANPLDTTISNTYNKFDCYDVMHQLLQGLTQKSIQSLNENLYRKYEEVPDYYNGYSKRSLLTYRSCFEFLCMKYQYHKQAASCSQEYSYTSAKQNNDAGETRDLIKDILLKKFNPEQFSYLRYKNNYASYKNYDGSQIYQSAEEFEKAYKKYFNDTEELIELVDDIKKEIQNDIAVEAGKSPKYGLFHRTREENGTIMRKRVYPGTSEPTVADNFSRPTTEEYRRIQKVMSL
ncbi:MAG: hypothetical protein AAF195_03370 [Pseudomonadota bacterium]